MHHPRSNTAVLRFRLAALLLVGNGVVAVVAAGLLIQSLMSHDRRMTIIGGSMMILVFLLVVVQWLVASRATCPLCRTPVLAPMRCTKHRRARSLLGSHRLRAAMAILFRKQFRCPYCNESTLMELREPRVFLPPPHRGSQIR